MGGTTKCIKPIFKHARHYPSIQQNIPENLEKHFPSVLLVPKLAPAPPSGAMKRRACGRGQPASQTATQPARKANTTQVEGISVSSGFEDAFGL